MGWAAGQGGVGQGGEGGVGWEMVKIPVWDVPWTTITPTQWSIPHQWAT